MTLFEYMEDFDNWELSTQERMEQLIDAIVTYNEEHGTNFNPDREFFNYERQRKQQDE